MALCLVTGGAGFLGSHLADALDCLGHDVRVLDDFSTGREANLTSLTRRAEVVLGDVADPVVVSAAARNVDYVFHLATPGVVSCERQDALRAHLTCVMGTLHILAAALECRARRVIYASSSCVYGRAVHGVVRESDLPYPVSAYAAAKLAGEHYCAAFTRAHGLQTVRLRFFNVYGPRMTREGRYASVVPLVGGAVRMGQRPAVAGDGLRTLDFTYVSDAVQGLLLAMEAPRVAGKVYNIGGNEASLVELVRILNALLGSRVAPMRGRSVAPDFRHNRPDIAHAQTDMGFCPGTTLEEGLRRYVEAERLPAAGLITAAPARSGRPASTFGAEA